MATEDLEKNLTTLELSIEITVKQLDDLAKNIVWWADERLVNVYDTTVNEYKKILDNLKKDIEQLSWDEKTEKEERIKKIEWDLKKLEENIRGMKAVPAETVPQASEKWDQSWNKPEKNRTLKEWFIDQRNGLTSKKEWEQNKLTNILRAAWWVWIVWWAVSLYNRVFNWTWGDNENWFWQRPFWKAIKWILVWVWAGALRTKLSSSELTAKAEDQADDTVELKENDPEKYNKYKWLGENVDSQYNTIMEKEINSWRGWMSIADWYEKYADKNNIDKDVFQATVPMCIDNQYSSVSKFLSEWWYYSYLRWLKYEQLKEELLGWTKEQISRFLWPFLINLTSFIPYKWQDWKKWLEDRLNSWTSEERHEELELFFRQYVKVLNYTQEKLYCLEEEIAERKIHNVTDKNYSTVQDALKDEKFLEEFVYLDPYYLNFTGWKLHQAVDVMKEKWMFNGDVSDDMKRIIKQCDNKRNDILKYKDWKDAFDRLDDNADNLTNDNYAEGVKCCDDVISDIDKEFEKSFRYLYFSATEVLTNNIEISRQEFLKHSWFNKLKEGVLEVINDYKQKFASWEITTEEIALYKNQVNSWFAMKKEIEIWARAIQKMKSDNPSFWEKVLNIWSAVLSDLREQTKASISHFKDKEYLEWWTAATLPLIAWGAVIRGVWKRTNVDGIVTFGKWVQKANIFSTLWHVKWVPMRLLENNLNNWPDFLIKARYDVPHWDQLLLQDLIEWKISWNPAERVIKDWNIRWHNVQKSGSTSEFIQKMLWKDAASIKTQYFDILFDNWCDIDFMSNPSIRKMFFGEPTAEAWDTTGGRIINWFKRKKYTPDLSFENNIKVLEEFLVWQNGTTSVFKTLTPNQQIFVKQLIKNGEFKSLEEVKAFLNNVKNYNLDGLDEAKITKLVEELIEHTDELGDVTKINKRISDAGSEIIIDPARMLPEANPHFKSLSDDLDVVEAQITKNRNLDDLTNIEKKQLSEISEFKKTLGTMDEKELERTVELLWQFKKEKGLAGAIDEFTTLRKLEGKFCDIPLPDWSGVVRKNFDEILKTMDVDGLKALGKQAGLGDDVIEPLADTFRAISRSKITKAFWSLDEMADVFKTFMKVFGKLT